MRPEISHEMSDVLVRVYTVRNPLIVALCKNYNQSYPRVEWRVRLEPLISRYRSLGGYINIVL